MSEHGDDVTQDAPAADAAGSFEPATAAPTRAPSPGALAASRARRIGGRPTPGPRPAPFPAGSAAVSAPAAPRRGETESGAAAASKTVASKTTAGKTAAGKTTHGKPASGKRASGTPASVKPASARTGPVHSRDSAQVSVAALGRIFAMVAGVAAVLLAATTAWLSHGVWWDKPTTSQAQTQQVREQVLAAATTCLSAVTNYDYRSIPAAEKAGVACSTGAFQAAYKKAMQTTVTTYAPQTKTAQTFQANKAGIISVSPDGSQWVVLLYGQQAVTNTSHAAGNPQLDVLSARVTLNKVGGKWLISALAQA